MPTLIFELSNAQHKWIVQKKRNKDEISVDEPLKLLVEQKMFIKNRSNVVGSTSSSSIFRPRQSPPPIITQDCAMNMSASSLTDFGDPQPCRKRLKQEEEEEDTANVPHIHHTSKKLSWQHHFENLQAFKQKFGVSCNDSQTSHCRKGNR